MSFPWVLDIDILRPVIALQLNVPWHFNGIPTGTITILPIEPTWATGKIFAVAKLP